MAPLDSRDAVSMPRCACLMPPRRRLLHARRIDPTDTTQRRSSAVVSLRPTLAVGGSRLADATQPLGAIAVHSAPKQKRGKTRAIWALVELCHGYLGKRGEGQTAEADRGTSPPNPPGQGAAPPRPSGCLGRSGTPPYPPGRPRSPRATGGQRRSTRERQQGPSREASRRAGQRPTDDSRRPGGYPTGVTPWASDSLFLRTVWRDGSRPDSVCIVDPLCGAGRQRAARPSQRPGCRPVVCVCSVSHQRRRNG